MILKTGKNLDWEKTMSYPTMNLRWYANSTQNITSIVITNPAPATQKP
tara:strand:+ start:284 stop:427 length:144 start_codon:yes stop_codon:yes gene_type:complete